jgi:hypothetical protein
MCKYCEADITTAERLTSNLVALGNRLPTMGLELQESLLHKLTGGICRTVTSNDFHNPNITHRTRWPFKSARYCSLRGELPAVFAKAFSNVIPFLANAASNEFSGAGGSPVLGVGFDDEPCLLVEVRFWELSANAFLIYNPNET